MSLVGPGSFVWLFRHELRLAWRDLPFLARRNSRTKAVLLVGMALFLHLPFLGAALSLAAVHVSPGPLIARAAAAVILVFLMLMFSQALMETTKAIYMRGDFDLLGASPLPLRRIMAVRVTAVAGVIALSWLALVAPIADAVAIAGDPRWLAAYPVTIALALLATAFGLLTARLLWGLVGPRQARRIAQVLASLIGAVGVLASQAAAFFPEGRVAGWWAGLVPGAAAQGARPWWPARAFTGEPLPLAGVVLTALIVYGLVIWAFAARFAEAAGSEGERAPRRLARRDSVPRFRGGDRRALLLRKEWRLIARDPWLISHTLMQTFYIVLLLVVATWAVGGHSFSLVRLAPVLIYGAGSLAGSLAWITVAGEDAPDLLGTAPLLPGQAMRAKLWAALLPIAVLLAPAVVTLAWQSPRLALAAAMGASGAAFCASLLSLKMQAPGKRRDISQRPRGSALHAFLELLLNALWAGATYVAIRLLGAA